MLKHREADVSGLLVALVVLPLVVYFLLGKWKEALDKKEKIRVLAKLASEESVLVDFVHPPSDFLPAVTPFKANAYVCAWCLGPATTRCSRCKSVRYCSGRCQIVHWRQGHKDDCQQLGAFFSTNELYPISPNARSVSNEIALEHNIKTSKEDRALSKITVYADSAVSVTPNTSYVSSSERTISCSGTDFKTNGEMLKTRETFRYVQEPVATNSSIRTTLVHNAGHATKCGEAAPLEDSPSEILRRKEHESPSGMVSERPAKGSSSEDQRKNHSPRKNFSDIDSSDIKASRRSSSRGHQSSRNGHRGGHKADPSSNSYLMDLFHPHKDDCDLTSSNIEKSSKGRASSGSALNTLETKASARQKSLRRKCSISEMEKADVTLDSKIIRTSVTATASFKDDKGVLDDKNDIDARKPLKCPTLTSSEDKYRSKRIKETLYPYEDFLKLFNDDLLDLCPRGLLNCGNSCYANAILQCLTFTKPLITYLLQRCHSMTCYRRDWCLMCQLEQHVLKLREGGSPLSPAAILSQLQKNGGQMGSGSQEDAHEFLRLLVASMQFICLSGHGVEKSADCRLHETTFIHQTFGGCLRSRVKCLRCLHESERYENIMDLTLEILGWVESLEDALAQFTSPEDLDADNLYRCARCSAYVRARKQLNIHDVPNVLTIVLKRFQTGKYGKINKRVTFPEMLDMIPYMTGTSDVPPLYMLYGVVVHLDTQNASFSGHYVSYIKDLQGVWFRIDDTVVEPVSIGQVMSEGAYILFYSRSYPRPPKVYQGKANSSHFHASGIQRETSVGKPSRHSTTVPRGAFATTNAPKFFNSKFSDITSSDSSSIFTSSEDGSFTTESDRYSTSTMDHHEAETLFNSFNIPERLDHETSCRMFSPSRMGTRYFSENNTCVLDASMLDYMPTTGVHTRKHLDQIW